MQLHRGCIWRWCGTCSCSVAYVQTRICNNYPTLPEARAVSWLQKGREESSTRQPQQPNWTVIAGSPAQMPRYNTHLCHASRVNGTSAGWVEGSSSRRRILSSLESYVVEATAALRYYVARVAGLSPGFDAVGRTGRLPAASVPNRNDREREDLADRIF